MESSLDRESTLNYIETILKMAVKAARDGRTQVAKQRLLAAGRYLDTLAEVEEKPKLDGDALKNETNDSSQPAPVIGEKSPDKKRLVLIHGHLINGAPYTFDTIDSDYDIRYAFPDDKGWYCFLRSRNGQNLWVNSTNHGLTNVVRAFENGKTRFGSIRELYEWAERVYGYPRRASNEAA